jgi:hypothetical protein
MRDSSQHARPPGFSWTPHPDSMQKVLLALSVFDLFFFSYYLFNFEIARQSTISDTLFTDSGYKVVLTVLLACRLLGGAFFLYRFRFKHCLWEWTGILGILVSFGGWCYLVTHKDNTHHFTGVGLFCFGAFAYSLAFVRLAATSEDCKELLHAIMEAVLLLGVVLLVIAFVGLWFEEEDDGRHNDGSHDGDQKKQLSAYIVEHAAYIGHLCFYAFFFLYHSPDVGKPVDGKGAVGESYHYYDQHDIREARDGVPMVCRPLILMHPQDRVLHTVMET